MRMISKRVCAKRRSGLAFKIDTRQTVETRLKVGENDNIDVLFHRL